MAAVADSALLLSLCKHFIFNVMVDNVKFKIYCMLNVFM